MLSSEALWRGTPPAYHSPSADDPRKKSLPRKGKDAFAWYHLAFILCQGAYRKSKSPCPLWDRGEIAVPPCIILMAPVRNVDDASIYLIQRGACGRVRHILHTGFHLPPALCYLRNMTFFRSSLFIFKLKLSYRLQTLLSTIDFISNKNIFTAPHFITAFLHCGQKS